MAATIHLIRHGETTWNRAGRLQGQADSPLTLKGTHQIEAVANTLQNLLNHQNYVFWASPIGRTRQSASIICDIIGANYENIMFDDRLKEITLGERDGYSSWQALKDDYPEDMAEREKDPWHYQHPKGESSQMVLERLTPFLEELEMLEGVHVVVSHGVISKIFRGLYLNLSHAETFALDRPQESFYCLRKGNVEIIEAISK